ncbi:MAG: hypothetical protein L3K26_01375, partial [Candidatus Hydrogenedentes bacterium]|nr:hypothetical protein [Candidatus Hydrogenedentota bacterium]
TLSEAELRHLHSQAELGNERTGLRPVNHSRDGYATFPFSLTGMSQFFFFPVRVNSCPFVVQVFLF